MKSFSLFKPLVALFAVVACGTCLSLSQTEPGKDLTSASLLQYLDQTINWYHLLDLQRQMASDPQEEAIVTSNQDIAKLVALQAVEFARKEADSIEKEEAAAQGGSQASTGASRYQALRQMLSSLDEQIRTTQAELESLRQSLADAAGRQRESLQTRIAETQSEVQLAQARREAIQSMAEFVSGTSANGLGATGIREQIEALARTVPAVLETPPMKGEAAPVAKEPVYSVPPTSVQRSQPSGVWGLTTDILDLSRKIRTIRDAIQATDALSQRTKEVRSPLVNTLRELSKRGDDLAAQADTADQFMLAQEKAILDALTAQFKRTTAYVLPLSKQGILLEQYKSNLTNWQGSLSARYSGELRDLIVRLAILLLFLSAIFGGASLWRRAIFRYVRDARRRYQYLLLRKIVLWCVIAVVLIFAFASEISSVATFAGLITAGVAVALQSVILSVVGYFFLIGKYGVRVGDTVQVAGITGEVLDVGLVRFHLIELVRGSEKTASGRIVAFSNSIVFQSSAGLFKQIPGTNFVWHELTLTVAPDGDYRLAEERLRGVVARIFSEYRDELEKQYQYMEKTLTNAPTGALEPTSRLHASASGLEVVIRYPLDLTHASEIDDRVTREVLNVIDQEPGLKPQGTATPLLRLKTDLTG